ncbi:MAG TPA: hypothetical protein DEP69_01190 [Acidimicrobiaceae bacterium]|nr:hypothetical protein [Acidimicrobiaceae bacterium]
MPPDPGIRSDVWTIVRKDLAIERRARITVGQVLPLTVVLLVVFAFAFDANAALLNGAAAGVLWVAVVLGALMLIRRSFDVETAGGNLDGLRLSGAAPAAVFLGKAAALLVQLLLVAAVATAGLVVAYDARVDQWALLVLTLVAGCVAVAVCGTLYGVLVVGAGAADTLLALLLIPVVAPVVLAGSRALDVALGVSTGSGFGWTALLAIVAAIYTTIGLVAFGPLLEEA